MSKPAIKRASCRAVGKGRNRGGKHRAWSKERHISGNPSTRHKVRCGREEWHDYGRGNK